MSRQEQVLEEETVFQRFRDLLELSITQEWIGPVRHTDKSRTPIDGAPDFLVKNSSDYIIGIELLSLTNQEKQKEAANRWKAINQAKQHFKVRCNLALWVTVHWSGYVGALPVSAMADELFKLLFAYRDRFCDDLIKLNYGDFIWGRRVGLFPKSSENDRKPELHLENLSIYVESVTIQCVPDGMQEHWKYFPTDYIPTIRASELMEKKQSKEDKVKQYLHYCQEIWLLIYYGVVRKDAPSLALEVDINLECPVSSKFNMIWLLKGSHSLQTVQLEKMKS